MTGEEMFKFKNWAVVGDVLNERKVAPRIVRRLENSGFNVFKVNPKGDKNLLYTSLKDIKDKVDVIDLVINPREGLSVVKEAHQLGIDKIFIQPGACNEEIRRFCREKGIHFYESCVLSEL